MVGIFGYLSQDVNETILNEIVSAIKDEDYCITDQILNRSCVLGKLNIKSTEVKELIKTKKEDKISIVTCGEIYNENIENLDKSILRLYEEGRLDKLKDFNGSFAAAIYDDVEEKLTLVNDRYGLIKLFYYYDEDRFCFAPKIRPLIRLGAETSLRTDAIVDFFLFGYLLEDKTFFEHIRQLPPASILEGSKSDMKLTKYWDYEYDEDYHARPQEELIVELGTLWQGAVERRIKKSKSEKILIPLSGGLDSRAILAAALRCTPRDNIITFTFGEKGSFDFVIGKKVAEKAGVKNIPLVVEKEDFEEQYNIYFKDTEGMNDATPYFALKRYMNISKLNKKIISGYMGDALMGDTINKNIAKMKIPFYENSNDSIAEMFRYFCLNDKDDVVKLLNKSYFGNIDMQNSFNETVKEIYAKNRYVDLANYYSIWDYKYRRYKYEMINVFRFTNLFTYITPILDNSLVDFMLKISPDLRLRETLYKSMLLKKYPELFELPTKTNQGLKLNAGNTSLFLKRAILFSKTKANKISTLLLKRNIFLDKNKNYIDYDNLIRRNKEYRNYMSRMIEKVEEREYFNKDYIEDIWKLHMQGKKNYSMLFGLLVTFELFLEGFVDE